MDEGLIDQSFSQRDGNYYIKEEYKLWTSFREHNLIADTVPRRLDPRKQFDLIFCRNVTIYFDHETTKKLAHVFFDALDENAYLIVGHAEHSANHYALFKSRSFPDAIVYQKPQHREETKQLKAATQKKTQRG